MITLCGSPISNYYNKVKLALLEKGVPFQEEPAQAKSAEERVRSISPLGKIPFLRTEDGRGLCESQVILDYVEARWPSPPLLPADPFEAAKVRELVTFIDWHLEMAARQLYAPAFFGGEPLSEKNAARIRREIEERIAGLKQLAKFAPFVAGSSFTMADCSAFNNLPLVALATRTVYGEDLLAAGGVDYKPYLQMVGERATAQKVVADRKAEQAKYRK